MVGLETSNLQRPAPLIGGMFAGGSGGTPSPLTSGTSVSGREPNSSLPQSASDATPSRREAVLDRVDLSANALALAQSDPRTQAAAADTRQSSTARSNTAGPNGELTEAEQKQVDELKKRDQEVRNHEQAHQRVGGQYASAPSYEYQKGPDGRSYAVGGQVQIDSSAIPGDPDATIEKMRIVKAAALAPAEPSAQDRKVAAAADSTAQQAQAEKMQMEREEREAMLNREAEPGQIQDGKPASALELASNSDPAENTQSERGSNADKARDPNAPETVFSSGIEAQSALINQANGAYTSTTRAQSISQIAALIA